MKIGIIGAGGFGREVLAMINHFNGKTKEYEVIGFIDDSFQKGTLINGLPIIGKVAEIEALNIEGVVVAIANPAVRKLIVEKLPEGILRPNIIHPTAIILDPSNVSIGIGNIIGGEIIITTNVEIGSYCFINWHSTVGHDSVIGNYSSIMPSVNITGGAKLGEGVFIGTGAKLIKATVLGAYSTVGAGAVVDCDVEPSQTVVGVPARPIKLKA